jgi:hypothetical protein
MDSNNAKNATFMIWFIVLIVLLLSTPTKCNQKEGFYTNSGYFKKYCPTCRGLSRYQSGQCSNCGYCISANGYGRSVPGDSVGPYYDSDCLYYDYGDPFYYYPYSHSYPIIKTKTIYPQKRRS